MTELNYLCGSMQPSIPFWYGRAQPDDLYDPPPEAVDPYLIDEDDFMAEDVEDFDEDEDED